MGGVGELRGSIMTLWQCIYYIFVRNILIVWSCATQMKKWSCKELYNLNWQSYYMPDQWHCFIDFQLAAHNERKQRKVFCIFSAKFSDWKFKVWLINCRLLHQCKNIGAFAKNYIDLLEILQNISYSLHNWELHRFARNVAKCFIFSA